MFILPAELVKISAQFHVLMISSSTDAQKEQTMNGEGEGAFVVRNAHLSLLKCIHFVRSSQQILESKEVLLPSESPKYAITVAVL